jgi:hypothetical protein
MKRKTMHGILASPRTIAICTLTVLVLSAVSLININPAVAAGQAPRLKNCIENPVISGNLTLNICTERTHYRSGGIVSIVFLLANTGADTVTLSSITGGVFITSPTGKLVMRLAILECLGSFGNCLLPAQSSRTITVRWNTTDPLATATVAGTYSVELSFSACPANPPCLEAVASQLLVKIALAETESHAE